MLNNVLIKSVEKEKKGKKERNVWLDSKKRLTIRFQEYFFQRLIHTSQRCSSRLDDDATERDSRDEVV